MVLRLRHHIVEVVDTRQHRQAVAVAAATVADRQENQTKDLQLVTVSMVQLAHQHVSRGNQMSATEHATVKVEGWLEDLVLGLRRAGLPAAAALDVLAGLQVVQRVELLVPEEILETVESPAALQTALFVAAAKVAAVAEVQASDQKLQERALTIARVFQHAERAQTPPFEFVFQALFALLPEISLHLDGSGCHPYFEAGPSLLPLLVLPRQQ